MGIAGPLLLVATAGVCVQDPTAAYLAGFESALVALDGGANDTSEQRFMALERYAPDAPVWRVCAGVAAARAGRAEAARAHFEAGLARGYPVSDLAALHLLGADVAAGRVDVAVAGTVPVSVGGLREVPADARHMRDLVVRGQPLGPFTHLVGRFCIERGRRVPQICARISAYLVDWDGGTLRDVSSALPHTGRQEGFAWPRTRGGNDPDTALPRPRGPAFLRLLRVGLHVDDTLRVTHTGGPELEDVRGDSDGRRMRVSVDGDRWERRRFEVDLDTLSATRLPDEAVVRARAPDQLMALAEASRALRAREWFLPSQRSMVQVRAVTRPGEREPWVLVAHVHGELPHVWQGAACPPLRVLSPEGDEELAVVPIESFKWDKWSPLWLRILPPLVVPEHDRLVLAYELDATIVALDTSSWTVAWRHEARPTALRRIEARGRLLHVDLVNSSECELIDVRTGEVRFFGAPLGLERALAGADEAFFVGDGRDSLFVFAADALRPEPDGVEPAIALWFVYDDLVAVALDGTWALPTRLLTADARVLVGEELRAAAPLAPWLLDPLHVRTAHLDQDLTPRRVPAR